jgi:hypothetical protein
MFLSNSNVLGINRSEYGYGVARLLVIILLALSIIFPSGLMPIKAGVFVLNLVIVLIGMTLPPQNVSLSKLLKHERAAKMRKSKRRRYTLEFEQEAVRLVELDQSQPAVAGRP